MLPSTFLYLAFGSNTTNHSMAYFSFLSLKKLAPSNSRFIIYTDKPEFYQFLSPEFETRMLSPETLNEWQGKHKFLWRIKIKALLDSAQRDSGHLFYMDTDTFAVNDISKMIEQLDSGNCFMHLKESFLSEDKAKNKILMWQQTQNKTFGGMIVDKHSAMWNAGVVAINEKDKVNLLSKALQSTDEMCEAQVEQWLIEQFSLSQALASTGKLKPCDEWIAHYWGFKKDFIQRIDGMLAQTLQKQLSKDQLLEMIDINSWVSMMTPKPKRTLFQKIFRIK